MSTYLPSFAVISSRELAAAGATKVGLEASPEDLRGRLADVQMRLDQSHDEYAVEREKLAERTRLEEHRFADMEKRALLEVDRERTTSARLQKALETERGAHAAASERLHADHNAALSTSGKLREQVGALQNSVDTFDKERNREGAEIQSLRVQLEAAILQAAVDSARAQEIRGELRGSSEKKALICCDRKLYFPVPNLLTTGLDRPSYDRYRNAASFPKTLLHPTIADDVWLNLARGDYATAVFQAFRAVAETVRTAGGFRPEDVGTDLMRRAFNAANGPLAARNQATPAAEIDALANLFAGAIGSYKNPHSHRTVDIVDVVEAQEMVMRASHLLRIVDARRAPAAAA